MPHGVPDETIEHFGAQWRRYPGNEGYYASTNMLSDICEPLLPVERLADKVVVEIGSGSGRIVNMLLDVGVRQVVAVEPSAAMDVLAENVAPRRDRVVLARVPGAEAPDVEADFALSIGVLHHIAEPDATVRRMFDVLKPGGEVLCWLYGREGNERYLRLVEPLRRLTPRIPDGVLAVVGHALNVVLGAYVALARVAPVPMRGYARNVLGQLSRRDRFLVIFDQLNPGYAKYYTREEAVALVTRAGFVDVRIHHRHAYSWTVVGRKPA